MHHRVGRAIARLHRLLDVGDDRFVALFAGDVRG